MSCYFDDKPIIEKPINNGVERINTGYVSDPDRVMAAYVEWDKISRLCDDPSFLLFAERMRVRAFSMVRRENYRHGEF